VSKQLAQYNSGRAGMRTPDLSDLGPKASALTTTPLSHKDPVYSIWHTDLKQCDQNVQIII